MTRLRALLTRLSVYLLIVTWPFLFCWQRVALIDGTYFSISNDFDQLYYTPKLYLLASLAEGHLPLWSPSEGAGFPFFSSPFSQTFYPLNLPLLWLYHVRGAYSLLDHQRFTVLGVSIFALGLYCWLKQFRLRPRAILFASLLTSVSFKVVEILRFPNAVHTAAWYPWILLALTSLAFSKSKKQSLIYSVWLVFFASCFLTGGYPYYNYYGLFLFGPYLALLLIGRARYRFFGVTRIRTDRFLIALGGAGLATLALCGGYLLSVARLMSATVDRGGKNFDYSVAHVFNLEDTVGSLIFPPSSQAEGWYYFGILAVLLMVVFFAHEVYEGPSSTPSEPSLPPSNSWYHAPFVKLTFVGWFGLISYITYGRSSALFGLLWHYLPCFSSLRVWGRMNIILVPILGLVLAVSYDHFERLLARRYLTLSRWKLVLLLSGAYLIILGLQLELFLNKRYDFYWTEYFADAKGTEPNFIWAGAFSFLALFVLLAQPLHNYSQRAMSAIVFCLLLGVAATDVRGARFDPWMWSGGRSHEAGGMGVPSVLNAATFGTRRIDRPRFLSTTAAYSVGIPENWFFGRYVAFLARTEGQRAARRVLLGVTKPSRLYLSKRIQYAEIQSFLDDAAWFQKHAGFSVISYTGDQLTVDISSSVAGYLSFIDNWEEGWGATADGRSIPIEQLFGTFKSVRIAPGKHRIIFSYQPRFW